jgi:hypothetical protein
VSDALELLASVDGDAEWPYTCPVSVRLRNAGGAPLLVCRRLAPGYREADGRELFADVHPPGADDVVSRIKKLYDRDPPAPEDYVALAPGEELEGGFDLLRWYALPGPGDYELEVFYEGDGRGTPRLEGLAHGVHASPRTPFTLPG